MSESEDVKGRDSNYERFSLRDIIALAFFPSL